MTSPSNPVWQDIRDEATREEILDGIDMLWSAVWPALSTLSADALDAPVAGQEWCPRELMAHLAHWNEAHRFAVSEHIAGRTANIYAGWRPKNDQWFGEDATISARDASSRLRDSHVRLRELLQSLTAPQWDDEVRAFVLQCPLRHYREHLEALVQ
ncbi:MAG: maleylpyruvate isomerase N-terminal domain-containing protein [Chloroflexota bacterium]